MSIRSQHRTLFAGALLAGLGVALGAFGVHALRASLDERHLGWWRTAVEYQMWHAIALIALASVPIRTRLPAGMLVVGTVLFSGSLYAMALTDARWLGAVTPIGGMLMIAGWSVVCWRSLAERESGESDG